MNGGDTPTSRASRPEVHSIRTLALFNGLQGALEVIVAAIVVLAGLYGPAMLELLHFVETFEGGMEQYDGDPRFDSNYIAGRFVAGFGVALFIFGCLRIVAAANNRKLRSHKFGLASLIMGVLSSFTVICAPTSIALLIWGLVVYSRPSVKSAFDEANEGLKSGQPSAVVSNS